MNPYGRVRYEPNKSGHRACAPRTLRVAVVGGGVAGIAAAVILAERGIRVTLIEREGMLGGRAATWPDRLETGEAFEMERGHHTIFRHYFNTRRLLRRVDPELEELTSLNDYPVLGHDHTSASLANFPRSAPFTMLAAARRTRGFGPRALLRIRSRVALEMLRFDPQRTFARYDRVSAREFLDAMCLPQRARTLILDALTHSFFDAPDSLSAAELLQLLHVHLVSNPEGLIPEVSAKPLGEAYWRPFAGYLSELGVDIRTETALESVSRRDGGWRLNLDGGETLSTDALILAVTVPTLRSVVERSPELGDPVWRTRMSRLASASPYAVWRIWLDRPVLPHRQAFTCTVGTGLLNNIVVLERSHNTCREWARNNTGSVLELHARALPPNLTTDVIEAELREALSALYPETRGAEVVAARFQRHADGPAFGLGSDANRPGVETSHDDVFLAGDFVRLPVPTSQMERAVTAGMLAANTFLTRMDVRGEPIWSVPPRGVLGRLPDAVLTPNL